MSLWRERIMVAGFGCLFLVAVVWLARLLNQAISSVITVPTMGMASSNQFSDPAWLASIKAYLGAISQDRWNLGIAGVCLAILLLIAVDFTIDIWRTRGKPIQPLSAELKFILVACPTLFVFCLSQLSTVGG